MIRILFPGKKSYAMYKVLLYKQAAKYYGRLDLKIQKRINNSINEIMKEPFNGIHIKKLKGRLGGKYRCDIGGLRNDLFC